MTSQQQQQQDTLAFEEGSQFTSLQFILSKVNGNATTSWNYIHQSKKKIVIHMAQKQHGTMKPSIVKLLLAHLSSVSAATTHGKGKSSNLSTLWLTICAFPLEPHPVLLLELHLGWR